MIVIILHIYSQCFCDSFLVPQNYLAPSAKKEKKEKKKRKLIIAVGFVVIVTFVDGGFFVSNFNGSAFSV